MVGISTPEVQDHLISSLREMGGAEYVGETVAVPSTRCSRLHKSAPIVCYVGKVDAVTAGTHRNIKRCGKAL